MQQIVDFRQKSGIKLELFFYILLVGKIIVLVGKNIAMHDAVPNSTAILLQVI